MGIFTLVSASLFLFLVRIRTFFALFLAHWGLNFLGKFVLKKGSQSAVKTATTTDVDHHQKPIIGDGNSSLANSMLKSGLKPWTCNMGASDSVQKSLNTKCPDAHKPQNPDVDDYGWGYCAEDQLEKILLKNFECLYGEAVSKLVALGYDEEAALKAALKEGYCRTGIRRGVCMDVLANILHQSLSYLNSGSCENDRDSYESGFDFTNLRELEERVARRYDPLVKEVAPTAESKGCLVVPSNELS